MICGRSVRKEERQIDPDRVEVHRVLRRIPCPKLDDGIAAKRSSTSFRSPPAIHRPDPGDDLPEVIISLDGFAEGRHRPDDGLGAFAGVALLLELDRAKRDQSKECIVVIAIDLNLIGEGRCHASTTANAPSPSMSRREASIKEKLDSAIHKGETWDSLKYEFDRDFNGLIEEFAQWEEQLDAEAIKREGNRA